MLKNFEQKNNSTSYQTLEISDVTGPMAKLPQMLGHTISY
jgi:hypothetical protein